jgi:predicted transcriptional regulator
MAGSTDEPGLGAPHIHYTSAIAVAYLQRNPLAIADVHHMIRSVHQALSGLAGGAVVVAEAGKPAVPVKRSITPDYIVCLEDGKKLKMLKRYIRGQYNLTPDQYRTKWGLPRDYPMVAPNYSAQRAEFAKKIGLGRTPKAGKKAVPLKRKRASSRRAGA